MAKLESSFKNMVLSLTLITLVAAAGLAAVYMVTQAQIEAQKEQAQNAARIAVLNGQEGTAIECTADGFGGPIRLMVGFAADGTILGYEVLEQQETPGLGTHIVEWFKDTTKPGQNIVGRQATGLFTVSKDGGDVDAITAATISSRAFLRAINAAYIDWKGQQGEQVEAMTGASMRVETYSADSCKEHHHEGQCCGHCEGKEACHE